MAANPPLFAADPDDACTAYRHVRAAGNPYTTAAKQHCEDLWAEFAPLADAHFLTQFPLHFHQRWFEMYTGVSLLGHGLDVQSNDHGPDLSFAHNGQRVWVECVCSTPGEEGHPDQVSEPPQGEAYSVPQDAVTLRITSSLATKAVMFTKYMKDGIVGPEDLLVVALNVHAVPHAWADLEDHMMRAVYGRGNLVYRLDRDTGSIIDQDYEQIADVQKASGEPIGVLSFVDGSMSHVTGLLGSRVDAANLPQRFGDDFTFLPNLTAANAWPGGIIQLGEEWTFAEVEDEWQGSRQSYIQEL